MNSSLSPSVNVNGASLSPSSPSVTQHLIQGPRKRRIVISVIALSIVVAIVAIVVVYFVVFFPKVVFGNRVTLMTVQGDPKTPYGLSLQNSVNRTSATIVSFGQSKFILESLKNKQKGVIKPGDLFLIHDPSTNMYMRYYGCSDAQGDCQDMSAFCTSSGSSCTLKTGSPEFVFEVLPPTFNQDQGTKHAYNGFIFSFDSKDSIISTQTKDLMLKSFLSGNYIVPDPATRELKNQNTITKDMQPLWKIIKT